VAKSLLKQLNSEWRFSDDKQAIQRLFQFNDFQETISFVNAIAWIANREDHHPDLQVGYNRCEVTFTSHIAKGITVNDFICAAKIDALFKKEQKIKPRKSDTQDKQKTTSGVEQKSEPALQFDAAEADALLKEKAQSKTPPPPTHKEEDEFKLIDPDHEPTIKQKAVTVPEEETDKVAKQKTDASTETPVAPEPKKPDIDLMATIILPPGMESVSETQKPADEDEEATVILPNTTATAEFDQPPVSDKDPQDTVIE
jgi:4a-hydroxytetrahydrobiopterin dehydratase